MNEMRWNVQNYNESNLLFRWFTGFFTETLSSNDTIQAWNRVYKKTLILSKVVE